MYIDALNEFCKAYALSGGDGRSDIIDLGTARDAYKSLWLVVKTNDADAAGGTSLNVKLETSDAEAFSSPKSLAESGTVLTAALKKSRNIFTVRIPVGCKRYLAVYFDVTGTFTAGSVHAFLTPDISTHI